MSSFLSRRAVVLAASTTVLAMIAGCAAGPAVRTDSEPGVDLGAYRTFAFYESGTPGYWSLAEVRLRSAAREQLERQNYRYDENQPDLRVNYALVVVDKQQLQSTPSSVRFGYRGWGGTQIETVEYRQGTLAIDLVDARRQALVWRAVAEGRLDAKAIEQPGPTIDATVRELFARFPGAAP